MVNILYNVCFKSIIKKKKKKRLKKCKKENKLLGL